MTAFGTYEAEPEDKWGGARTIMAEHYGPDKGHQWKFKFDNGYGASVIDDGYGSQAGLFELAVLGPDGHLDYSTPITDDVLGHLTADEVAETLSKIEALAVSA